MQLELLELFWCLLPSWGTLSSCRPAELGTSFHLINGYLSMLPLAFFLAPLALLALRAALSSSLAPQSKRPASAGANCPVRDVNGTEITVSKTEMWIEDDDYRWGRPNLCAKPLHFCYKNTPICDMCHSSDACWLIQLWTAGIWIPKLYLFRG